MAKGEYSTARRGLILQYLKDNSSRSVTAGELLRYLQAEGESAAITTVYRYLDKLASDGTVMKYTGDDQKHAEYQYAEESGGCEDHLHLKCVRCGSIYHLDCDFMDRIAEHVMRDHGFAIRCKGSVIYGVCRTCAREEDEKSGRA